MALILHPSSTFTSSKPHLLLLTPPLHPLTKPTCLSVKSQDPSAQSPKTAPPTNDSSSIPTPQPKKPSPAGLGFGSSSSPSATPSPNPASAKNKQKGKRERASITRREPLEKPKFVSQHEVGRSEEQNRNENAFLLTWAGLGLLIIVEGLLLAASGFLPEEWDKFFVKYFYPSFTPTVFLFVAGTVVYGVSKYLQNEDEKSQK
ncbi:hypothetical protein RJ639_027816 [Escallonia herrerae]|uniref:Protein LOW PSII ACCUMULATION 2, chloroplastic n=1 Tax=Escallonia herrerae TaxID=1293975 RepID=A0AA88XD46_9ASTE|nr:hypothetical protein RJ639_027816 [Escallonia herrerae]